MAKLTHFVIFFAKLLNVLGVLPLKLEYHVGILLLRKSRRLEKLLRLRIIFCFSHCVYLLFRTGQYVVDRRSFSSLDGTVLICLCMSFIFIFVLHINSWSHSEELCTFWNPIAKLYNSPQRHRHDGHHYGEVCERIKINCVWGLLTAFGLLAGLFCSASTLIFAKWPTHPIYISSVFLPQRLEDPSKVPLLLFAVYDLVHNVQNWCTIIF